MLDRVIIQFLKKYAVKHRLILFQALFLSIIQSLLLIPSLYFIKEIFDNSIPQNDISQLLINSAMILTITIVQSIIGFTQKNVFLMVVKKSITLLQKDVLQNLIWANNTFYNKTKDAKIINSVVSDVDKVDRMIDGFLAVVIPQVTLFILGLAIMIVYNPIIGMSTFILGVIAVSIQIRFKKSIKKFIQAYRKAIDDLTTYTGFLSKKQILTKLRNFEASEFKSAIAISDEVIGSGTAAAKKGLQKQTIDELIINISAIVLIVIGSIQILSDAASYGNIFGLYFLIVFLRRTAHAIQSQWTANQEGKVSLGRINELLSTTELEQDLSDKKSIDFDGSIKAEKVSFSYGTNEVLQEANFEIAKGEVVTISGMNGSGKSSLVKLLLGLYKPDTGNLFASKVNYQDLNVNNLRTQIGYVPQNQVLIDGTIASNLCYGIEADSLKAIQELDLYQELINGFDAGLDTRVSMNGTNLSNGQIQRISILRALCSDPKLLILDEPTNHLDAASIKILISAIQKELNISLIVISHHSLFNEVSDKSYSLIDGRIVLKETN